ncbi:MAG: hypothetical protein ACHQ9S_08785 [Candidatus Binatia bacterium]
MMRRRNPAIILLFPLLVAVTPLLLGMGSAGGRDVIHPAVDFRATLVDKDGTKVDVNRLNIGGDVQLEGDMGRGNLRVAFENIKSIDFAADSHDYSRATLHLKNGEEVTLRVRNSLMIYGQTHVGIYEIRARDLQNITFTS